MAKNKSKQIVGLDALRFMAALTVLVFHLGFWSWAAGAYYHGAFPSAYNRFIPFTWFGWVGVEVFFVLSGFVIAYSAQHVTSLIFFQHRLTRLLPAAVICSCLTALALLTLSKTGHKEVALRWAKSVVLSPVGPWIDSSYWTLSIEVAFYAVILGLLIFKKFQLMPTVMAWLGVTSSAFWVLASLPQRWRLYQKFSLILTYTEDHKFSNVVLLRHGCYFTVGVYLWLSLCSKPGWTPRRTAVILLSSVGGILQIIYRGGNLGRQAGYPFPSIVPVAVWLAAVAFIILAVKHNEEIHSAIGTRAATILRRLGLMTYPLYLLHQVIGALMILRLERYLSPLKSLAVVIGILIAIAYLVSAYAEPAVQGVVRRLFAAGDRSKRNVLSPSQA